MSDDFIKKADDSKDFNNGGIKSNSSGGAKFSDGPESPLSSRNQSDVEAKLEAVANTAITNQSSQSQLTSQIKNDSAIGKEPPCPPGQTRAPFLLNLSSVGRNEKCGCYVDLGISLSSFFSLGVIKGIYAPKTGSVVEAFTNFFGLRSSYLRQVASNAEGLFRDSIEAVVGSNSFGMVIAIKEQYKEGLKAFRKGKIDEEAMKIYRRNYKLNKLKNGQTVEELYDAASAARDNYNSKHTAIYTLSIISEVVTGISGIAYSVWISLGISRDKQCFGAGTKLNENTCACECADESHEICPATSNSASSFLASWVVPGLLPQLDEINTCGPVCCGGQVKYQFGSEPCKCACLGEITFGRVMSSSSGGGSGAADSTFKHGRGCDCLQIDYFNGDATRGKCVSAFAEERVVALGQTWNGRDCDFICSSTGTTSGPTCGGYGRRKKITWTDSQGNTYSNQDSLCECECVEPDDHVGTWPPTCDAGYVWNDNATICSCQPIPPPCPSTDPVCKRDDILTGQVVNSGSDWIFRGCTGCSNAPEPGTYISNPGSIDGLRAAIAGWAGDIGDYRICVDQSGGPDIFWDWYAYDCEAEGCGPCS